MLVGFVFNCFTRNIGTTHADTFHREIPCTYEIPSERLENAYETSTDEKIADAFAEMNPDLIEKHYNRKHGANAYYGQIK